MEIAAAFFDFIVTLENVIDLFFNWIVVLILCHQYFY